MAADQADILSMMPQRLRELRQEFGWTLDEVAQRMGFSQRAVASNWEATNQRRRIPDLQTLLKLQQWYGVSLDYLVGVPDAERDSPAVKVGKKRLRERLQLAPGLLTASPRERASLAVKTAMEVAPEAFFEERLAAYFQMNLEEFGELQSEALWSNRLLDRLASFLGLDREWFFAPEPAKVLERDK